ncbi:MAG TPA: hypothetical protein PKA41_19615, partial [Verrucomicrobiota bacterium]|nr:hypothetical protein [Verrucomicrobiota bacterium]
MPHEYELGVNLSPGKHTLTVRVDNRSLLPYRPDAHSISDSLAQSWNGIVGDMKLRADDAVWIEHVELKPDLARRGVEATIFIRNTTGEPVPARLVFLQVTPKNFGGNAYTPMQQTATLPAGVTNLTIFHPIGDQFETWSEFSPRFYSLRATIAGPGFRSSWEGTFGMRDVRAVGTDIVVNGQPAFFRGTHHGGDFPLTGYPPTDVEYWRKVFRTCKDWGLNHVRFHSYCPPKAAFVAADEIGIYLAIEPGMWNTFNPDSPMEDMLYRETERILKAYGNHPSFVMIAASNEPKGRWKDVLPKWAEHFRAIDPRHLYTTGTGFTDADAPGPMDKVDYSATQRFGSRQVRGVSGWFGRDYSRSMQGVNVPVVTHENGQWCAYPDFDVIKKFTGYMRPGNYEIFRDSAAANGVLEMNKEFAHASGRFQLECYKEEVEAALRTPGIAGFQLLDLHDYVGQGTALVGLLDTFWESKGYVEASEFKRYCNTVVPLARMNQRVFTTADKFQVPLDIANFGPAPLTDAAVVWLIQDEQSRFVVQGRFPAQTIPFGRTNVADISADISQFKAPGRYRLVV